MTEQAPHPDLWAEIHSHQFNLYQCIDLLRRHSDNIGVQYQLCKRATQYPITELRFFVPQFLQLLITVDTKSLALEEMVKALCSKDPHFSLITFWYLQALLQQLGAEPESVGFQTCKRLINELQYQLFNYFSRPGASSLSGSSGVVAHHDINQSFRENIGPALALQTSLMAGLTVPEATRYVQPIVLIQGKRVKTLVFEVLRDVKKSLTENLTKKNTLKNASLATKTAESDVAGDIRRTKSVTIRRGDKKKKKASKSTRRSDDLELDMVQSYADVNLPGLGRPQLKASKTAGFYHQTSDNLVSSHTKSASVDGMIASMPNLGASVSPENSSASYSSSIRESFEFRNSSEIESLSDTADASPPQKHIILTKPQQVKLLKSNYFRNTTQFVIALQNISIRLSKVPREARLSTLKAELALLNNDLPCEVDIPMLLPKSKRGRHHRLCHITVSESAVLNSAERVPYLLLVEYLADDLDFDPDTPENTQLLQEIQDSSDDGKYRFDLSYKNGSSASTLTPHAKSTRVSSVGSSSKSASVEESDLGDVSVVSMSNKIQDNHALMFPTKSFFANDTSLNSQIESSFKTHVRGGSDQEKNLAVQLRIAGIMLQQLQTSNTTLPASQAEQIRSRIVDSMKSMQTGFSGTGGAADNGSGRRKLSNDLKVAGLSYLGEDWAKKKARIRKLSPFGHLPNWDLYSMIAKTGDDLTQEAFACQLIQTMANMWYDDGVRVWVKRMRILVTSSNTGLVETITDALSVHSIKKSLTEYMFKKGELPQGEIASLKDHFVRLFGKEDSPRYKIAQQHFCASLAAYSVICYLLQIKDRHNGNIMIDSEGHIVHIDFGFLLSNTPGSVGFESAPFKLTQEYVDVLGGVDSFQFQQFKQLTKSAFKSIRNHADNLVNLVELMQTDSMLPCFRAGENTSVLLRQRLQLHLTDEQVDAFTEDFLINKSLNSAYTRLYDQFQLLTQGIYV